ncbi:MAG: DNA mismatch repair endonuclease MutL [Bacteroidaceae bacterium]|nr:DNA mismatch repair endonuclease MutL [Bacteroidaceae bacterium]
MSTIIRILPPDVASQIAAGEVVNRPSSVVKELLENAVDAGATQIKIVVVDAGRTSIQIIDNGAGMGSEDAVTAFQRHATSKIKESDDLYSLSTFGFRGEALASIAAVAQVELRTRRQEDETGTLVEAAASEIVNTETITCPAGSNFIVKNLFYNVPARRKFLKSNQTEFGHIMTEVERVAIVRPDIALSLFHQGEEVLSLPVSSLKQRLVNLFGKKINQQLLPVDVQTSVLSITGFAGNLDSVRRKVQEQYFFVNGRYMRHPYFHKAVQSAYEGMIQEGFQAPYFLFFEVPADTIDVNIHPTKTEIKFSDEQVLWKIVASAVKETVGRFESAPMIDFDTSDMPDIPVMDNTRPAVQPKLNYDTSYNPFKTSQAIPKSTNTYNWEKLYEQKENSLPDRPLEDELFIAETVQPKQKVFQHRNRYIVVSAVEGLLIIDQHRAHIRILYEKYLRESAEQDIVSQGLLFPEMFQLSPIDAQWYSELKDNFAAMGFDISDMGHGAIAVQGVPYGLENQNYETLILDILSSYRDDTASLKDGQLDRMAFAVAKKAAIKNGKSLSDDEIHEILDKLFETSCPGRTPDGKVVYIQQTDDQIDRLF